MGANADQVEFGAGTLYVAALASTEPVNVTTAWDAAWIQLGYTKGGSEFDYNPQYTDIIVEEELGAIGRIATGRDIHLKSELAQSTAANLKLALNGGSIVTAGGVTTYLPPAFGTEVYTMLGWEATDHKRRLVLRKGLQVGNIAIANKKTEYATISVDFQFFEIAGSQPFKWIGDSALAA